MREIRTSGSVGGPVGQPAGSTRLFQRAQGAKPALIDGAAGLAWAPGGQPRVVFGMKIAGGRIVEIDLIADPEHLGRLDLEIVSE